MNWKSELQYFFLALEFFTRIRKPEQIPYSEEGMVRSFKYFPIIGGIVGMLAVILGALVFKCTHHPMVSVLFMVGAGILLTGALHEDGLADVGDGFGGGQDKNDILRIMKDSRVGAFGVILLVMILLIKCFTLSRFVQHSEFYLCGFIYVVGQVCSRSLAGLMTVGLDYVSATGLSKSNFLSAHKELGLAQYFMMSIGVLSLLMLLGFSFYLPLMLLVVFYFMARTFFQQKINGYTGDCLGAVQQISEVIFYTSCLSIL